MIYKIHILMTDFSLIKIFMSLITWGLAFFIEFAQPHLSTPGYSNAQHTSERMYTAMPTQARVYFPNYVSDGGTTGTYFNTTDLRW